MKVKKKLAALLCALALAIPALCASEMTEVDYVCDACGYAGHLQMVVTGTVTMDGIPWETIDLQCPQCGITYTTVLNPAPGSTEPEKPEPSGQEPPAEPPERPAEPEAPVIVSQDQEPSPDVPVSPAEPEAPVAPPQDPSPESSGSGNGGQPEPPVVLPPEIREPSAPQASETLPPVPAGNPGPASANVPSGPAPQEPSAEEPDNPPAENPAGNPVSRIRRNLVKYPYFSEAYPSRRLNMEGDPEALAPIPGVQVYPELPAEGSSILQHMLNGD